VALLFAGRFVVESWFLIWLEDDRIDKKDVFRILTKAIFNSNCLTNYDCIFEGHNLI